MKRHCSLTLALALLNLLLAARILAAPADGRLPLLIEDTTGTDRQAEPVTTGVPFTKGRFQEVRTLTAVDAAGSPIPCQFTKISSWPDGSVRWALLDCQVDVKANGSTQIGIQRGQAVPPSQPVKITDTEDRVSVSTGPLQFTISKKTFNLFQSVSVDGKELITSDSPGLVLYPDKKHRVVAGGAPREVTLEQAGPMRAIVCVRGTYPGVHNGLLNYTVRITAYAGKPYLKLHVWLENDGKYGYTGQGEWYKFDGHAIEFDLGLGELESLRVDDAPLAPGTAGAGTKLKVAQHNPTRQWDGFKYSVTVDGKEVANGARTGGLVSLDGMSGTLTLGVRYFWENYSKAIELDGKRLKIWLWPADGQWPPVEGRWGGRGGGDFRQFRQAGVYHLPGCVRKGHEMILDFSGRAPKATEAMLRSPLLARAAPAYYAATEAAPGWFAPAAFKTGDEAYDRAVANWSKQALNAGDRETASSVWNARRNANSQIKDWYGWMNFGDNAWGGGYSSLHYDWPWIAMLNYLRQGDRGSFDLGVTMVRHLIEVDHLWSTRNHPMLQRMARFEFCSPYIHGGVGSGHCKPCPSHNWISGIVLYYMLTGDPIAYECALSSDIGLEKRLVGPLREQPTADRQARESGWAILCYCSLYDLTGDGKYLDKGMVLFRNHLAQKWKAKGPHMDGGLQYYYCTQGLCELQHRTGDPEIMEMLEAGCQGDFSDQYGEWRVFLSNIYAYVGYKKNKPEYIQKAKDLFLAYRPGGSPDCYRQTGAWDKETGKFIRNGHILQYVLWKTSR